MQHAIIRQPARALTALLAFVILAIGLTTSASLADHRDSHKKIDQSGAAEFTTAVPATPPATLTLTVNGKQETVGVPAQTGGTLGVAVAGAPNADVDVVPGPCPTGQVGSTLTIIGLPSGAEAQASFTAPTTGTISTGSLKVKRGANVTAELCAGLTEEG